MIGKAQRRKTIKFRIRNKIKGTAAKPRLSVYKSNKAIYCQLIDDVNGVTLASASSSSDAKGTKIEVASQVGKKIAEAAKGSNIDQVVFDRGGFLYHGRVKALADAAREGGLQF
jgi:large subunit ribosomal protein L18